MTSLAKQLGEALSKVAGSPQNEPIGQPRLKLDLPPQVLRAIGDRFNPNIMGMTRRAVDTPTVYDVVQQMRAMRRYGGGDLRKYRRTYHAPAIRKQLSAGMISGDPFAPVSKETQNLRKQTYNDFMDDIRSNQYYIQPSVGEKSLSVLGNPSYIGLENSKPALYSAAAFDLAQKIIWRLNQPENRMMQDVNLQHSYEHARLEPPINVGYNELIRPKGKIKVMSFLNSLPGFITSRLPGYNETLRHDKDLFAKMDKIIRGLPRAQDARFKEMHKNLAALVAASMQRPGPLKDKDELVSFLKPYTTRYRAIEPKKALPTYATKKRPGI